MKHTKTFDKPFLGAEHEHDDYQEIVLRGHIRNHRAPVGLLKGYRKVDMSEVWSWQKRETFQGSVCLGVIQVLSLN